MDIAFNKYIKIIVFLLFLDPFFSFAQITKGKISFEKIDSFSYEYQWKKGKGSYDTIVSYNQNFEIQTLILSDETYKNKILGNYDVTNEIFNENFVISLRDFRVIDVSDFVKKISTKYIISKKTINIKRIEILKCMMILEKKEKS